ncbi:hypothetical protein [Vreelandella sp. H-I2]
MKLLIFLISLFFASSVHAEVLDKVTTLKTSLLILAFLFFSFLIVIKLRKSWIFWPYVVVLSFLILGNADFILNDEAFHMASREYGSPGYMAYFYFELFFNISLLIFSFILYFKKNRSKG